MRSYTALRTLALLATTLAACAPQRAASTKPLLRDQKVKPLASAAPGNAGRVDDTTNDPLALDPDSPFFLVARGDFDLGLSVTEVGAFVTYAACSVAGDLTDPEGETGARPPREHAGMHVRRALGDIWLDDKLAQTPISQWTHRRAAVEARSTEDVWIRPLYDPLVNEHHVYFHWNGSVWEDDVKMLGVPKGLAPFGLLDWYDTKLVPLLPECDIQYQCKNRDLRQPPVFAVWGGVRAAPSFRKMAASVPYCRELGGNDQRYDFATLPNGDVFVMDRPCRDAAFQVARWSNGEVTVKGFTAFRLALTAGRLGGSDTMVLWGETAWRSLPLIYRLTEDRWVPVELPRELVDDRSPQIIYDQADGFWVDFGEPERFWRYDGEWHWYVVPENGNIYERAASHGDLWVSDWKNPWLYRLRGEQWKKFPLFRNQGAFTNVEVLVAGDDVWVRANATESKEVRIYRNRRMPLFEPCP